MIRLIVSLSATLLVVGCDNSKKTATAHCALDAAKIDPADARPNYARNCMRLAGYEFYGGLCGGLYSQPDDPACYVPVSTEARIRSWIDHALGF